MAKGKDTQGPSSRDMVPGFGEAVRARRGALGWSLNQLAEKAETHFTTVSKVERNQRAVSLRLACALAQALGVTVDALLLDAVRRTAASNAAPGPELESGRMVGDAAEGAAWTKAFTEAAGGAPPAKKPVARKGKGKK